MIRKRKTKGISSQSSLPTRHFTIMSLNRNDVGCLVILSNSHKDQRKGDKLVKRFLGPYFVEEYLGKGVYRLNNPGTGKVFKKCVNVCRFYPRKVWV